MGLHKGERKSPFARVPGDETSGRRASKGRAKSPVGHGGAGGAGTLLRLVMKRRNVLLAQKGSMPECVKA